MKKNDYYQMIRGVCIISVIITHILGQKNDLCINSFNVIIRTLINFCVGIFIFLSGYFVNVKKVESDNKKWIINRIIRLGVPFLIYSTLAATISLIKNGDSIIKFLYHIISGRSSVQLYYILALLQLVIFTPWLIKIIKKNKTIVNILILSITPIYYILIILLSDMENFYALNFATLFTAWLLYYYIGLYLNVNKKKVNNTVNKIINKYSIGYHIILTIIITIINLYMLYKGMNYSFIVTHLRILNMIYILSCIIIIVKLENRVKNLRWLVNLGDLSFGIYFIHTYFITIYSHIFNINNYYINAFVATVFVTLISYFSIVIFKKISKNKFDKVLDF